MYGENPNLPPDPYSQDYNDPLPPAGPPGGIGGDAPRGRSRTRSPPPRDRENGSYRSPYHRRSPAPLGSSGLPPSGLGSNGTVGAGTGGGGGGPRRPAHAPIAPNPSNVLGVFGLSIRTQERDLDEEFSRFGRVEKVTIVYDQRSDRSRGFGFIRMATVEDATRCIQELNGVDLNGRRIRVDYSVTDRPHAPTPGEYMGHRRATRDGNYPGSSGGSNSGRDRDRDRDRDRGDRDRDRDRDYYSSSRGGGDSYYKDREGGRDRRDRDRDYYGRDSRGDTRDWRERRSPPPPSRSGRYSPEYRRRRSYSRSPPRGSSPTRGGGVVAGREYDVAPPPPVVDARW